MREFTQERVLLLHQLLIEETGGSTGVRDLGLLDSAVQQAYAAFGGQELYPTKLEFPGFPQNGLTERSA